ncbi:hypothetical protein [uncultured Rikenella sp.]|uniref:hypothetical protein n=1 Tax=uncultured Rikenella sp. TaxID=368003 RepID=UPI002611CFDE|nr:hypothetical protein [uncultured Rikenella sp.]
MKVLSLFDGMSCGQIALRELGTEVETYYASEIDPPELMAFVRNNYPEVTLHRPAMNFYKLLEKKGKLPTRKVRWCCKELKEHAGVGTVTLVGIRAAESVRRAKRAEVAFGPKRERILRHAAESKEIGILTPPSAGTCGGKKQTQ